MKDKILKRSVWALLTVFFAIVFAIVVVGGQIAQDHAGWVDAFFGVSRYKLVNDGDGISEQDTQYFQSDYAVKDAAGNLVLEERGGFLRQTFHKEAMRANSKDVAERVNEEGAVLLWNKDGALPLQKGAKVSTFGYSSLQWILTGGGSGGSDMLNEEMTLPQALESRGFAVNQSLLAAMESIGGNYGQVQVGMGPFYKSVGTDYRYDPIEISWGDLNAASPGGVENVVAAYADAAIFTVSRKAGEDAEANASTPFCEDKSYLSFSMTECEVLEQLSRLKAGGKIKKIVLLINSANAMSLQYIRQYDIDACLWVGLGGNMSTPAVADLLAGNTDPSGHLTDTWVYDVESTPVNENFGGYTFQESEGLPASFTSDEQFAANDKYVVYQEGIYVGYRYYETRYEDLVLGGRNADSAAGVKAGSGSWSYAAEVAFPFGHGESYTEFEYSGFSVTKEGSDYLVGMTVKNVGAVAGKDVMQVYLQKPYTEYDRQYKIEKAAVELVGFTKTKELSPGESQELTVTVPEYEFKSYDSYNQKTYILEGGDYYLAAGENAHDALNNILSLKGYTPSDGMDGAGNASLANKIEYARDDYDTYAVSPFTGARVTNRFEDVDVNLYAGTRGQEITYLSRSDWANTYPDAVELTCTDADMIAAMQYEQPIPNDPADTMPVYETVTSAYGRLSLIQLRGIPYTDPMWEDLLDQMSYQEQADMIRLGSMSVFGAESVSAPGYRCANGPVCVNTGNSVINGSKFAFPCNPIVASSFNTELAEELGRAMGEESLTADNVGIYGTGANIHRSAYSGRNFEYYSEDGFLSGKINAAATRGMTEKGCVVFTKHFALNDQESFRRGITVWANEQTIREIYLKAFEAGITEAPTNGVMTSFSRIGTTWVGQHRGLLIDVLRGEWGFTGVAKTDEASYKYMGRGSNSIYATALVAGQDIWLDSVPEEMFADFQGNATVCRAMREAVHRNLYVMVNSAAMNGMSSDTRVERITPPWELAVLGTEIASGILAGCCLVMACLSWVFWYKKQKNKNWKVER